MRRWLSLLALALLLVGCGSVSHSVGQATVPHSSRAPSAVVVTANGHACDPNDYAMQCALAAQPPASPPSSLEQFQAIQGIDFGWSCPVSSAKSFGASYLSTDASKNWSSSCVRAFHQAGKAVVFVWETSATEALSGYAAGQNDARAAAGQAKALGAPSNVHIDFAIDFDETTSQAAAVASYFKGADSVLGVSRVGDYGGYYPTTRLCAAHEVTLAWQTYAWSGGQWAPASCAPLEQYLNSSSVDYDRAIAACYGQWSASGSSCSSVTPVALRCFGSGWTHNSTCDRVRMQDAIKGQEIAKENGYLKVSEANAAKIQSSLTPIQKQQATVEARLTVEVKNRHWSEVAVSAQNLAALAGKAAPLLKALAPIQARETVEKKAIALDTMELDASLKKYGYKKG